MELNRYDESIEYLDKACSIEPNNFRILFTIAEVYYKLKEYDKAMAYVTKAKQLNSTDSRVLLLIEKIEETRKN